MRIVIIMLIVTLPLLATWREHKEIALKKDQFERMVIKSDVGDRIFEFRWTLYSNTVLVVHSRFDGIVAQHLLKRNHTNQSFRLELLPRKAHKIKVPFLLVRFNDFDLEKREAHMGIYVKDDDEEIKWEYLKSE